MAKREPRSWDEMEALMQKNVNHLARHDTAAKSACPVCRPRRTNQSPKTTQASDISRMSVRRRCKLRMPMTLSLRNDVRMQSRMTITANTRGTGRNPGKGRTSRILREIWRSSQGMLTGAADCLGHFTSHPPHCVVACPQLRSQGKGARHA